MKLNEIEVLEVYRKWMKAKGHANLWIKKEMEFMRKALWCATIRADVILAKPEEDSMGSLSVFPRKPS